jgi:chromosome segregation ATPase
MLYIVVLLFLGVVGVSIFIFFSINSASSSQENNLVRIKDELVRKTKEIEDSKVFLSEMQKNAREKDNKLELANEQLKELNKLKDAVKQKEDSLAIVTQEKMALSKELDEAKKQTSKINNELASLNEVYSGLKEQYADLEKQMQKIGEEKIDTKLPKEDVIVKPIEIKPNTNI